METSGNGRKHPIDTGGAETSHPRKRAINACQQCRARKVKCDNARPTCGACFAAHADCIYQVTHEHSTLDQTSTVILDKLHEIQSQLSELRQGQLSNHHSTNGDFSRLEARIPTTTTVSGARASVQNITDDEDKEDGTISCFGHLRSSHWRVSSDLVLTWPVFENRYTSEHTTRHLYRPSSSDRVHDAASLDSGSTSFVLEQIPSLIDNFLQYVHIKNPILDARTLKGFSWRVCEAGLEWNAPTCLVLLACALGLIGQPFKPGQESMSEPDVCADRCQSRNNHARRLAHHYYSLAEQRLEISTSRLIKSQCYTLCGIYLMYELQPLRAYEAFVKGSNNLYMLLKSKISAAGRSTIVTANGPDEDQRLEQCVYWTCFKSECEIREELQLPPSSLADVHFPHLFPAPPSTNPHHTDLEPEQGATPSTPINWASPSKKLSVTPEYQSWFFYMTELSMRRRMDHIRDILYNVDHASWNPSWIREIIKSIPDFEDQLSQWTQSLPEPLALVSNAGSEDEIRYVIRARHAHVLLWIYRPFLYHVIHSRERADPQSVEYAYKLLNVCVVEEDFYAGKHHRHHGTWFLCRTLAIRCFLVLAAFRSGKFSMPDGWTSFVTQSLDTLRHWQDDSADVKPVIDVIEELMQAGPAVASAQA